MSDKSAGRFQAPFVMKMSFYSPSSKNQAKNAAHIKYIGTRPGAVYEHEQVNGSIELESAQHRPDPDTAAGHVLYAHERPGSHGLFSAERQPPNLPEIQKELQEHQGIVWRFVLSLTEADAKRLGYDDRVAWEDSLRLTVPLAAEKMGIKESNLRWVAAFHQEKGHPHVHLVIWEKEPVRRKGALSKGERIDVKKVFMKEIYADERVRLLQEKTAMRDLMRDFAKASTEKAVQLQREVSLEYGKVQLEMTAIGATKPGIPPKPYPDDVRLLSDQLKELSRLMPGKGRVALKFMPEEAKQKAREIAEKMVDQPPFKELYERYMKSVEEITRLHNIHPEAIKKAKDNAHNDLRDRLANVLLRGASSMQDTLVRGSLNRERGNEKPALQQEQQVARSVWRSVWRELDKERMRQEAQSEIEKRRELQRKTRAKQRENEQDRER
jgi:hypothetical protein